MPRRPAVPGIDRRQQILEAALEVFAEAGFEGATTKDIASRADVTQGLIYFYFPSKDDLFIEAFEHQAQRLLAQGIIKELDPQGDPATGIRHLFERLFEVLDEPLNMAMLRVMTQSHAYLAQKALGNREAPIHTLAHYIVGELHRYLEAQAARGALRHVDTQLAARLMTSSMISSSIRRALGDETLSGLDRSDLAERLSDIYLGGLLP
jgi:AcrR family transcriptional regulator